MARLNRDQLDSSLIARVINNIAVNTTAPSALSTDYVYHISAGGVILTLPSALNNLNGYNVMNWSSSNVFVTAAGSDTIDGSASITLIPNQSVTLYSNLSTLWGIF